MFYQEIFSALLPLYWYLEESFWQETVRSGCSLQLTYLYIFALPCQLCFHLWYIVVYSGRMLPKDAHVITVLLRHVVIIHDDLCNAK